MAENRNQGQGPNEGNARQRKDDDQDLGNRIDRDRTQARERGGERPGGQQRDDRGQGGRMGNTGSDMLQDDDDDLGSTR